MTANQIEKTYNKIREYWKKYLEKHGVTLPSLKRGDAYTKDALVLVYLAQGYPKTKTVTKTELTNFLKKHFDDVNDVQQARHLAAQKGFYILSGTRGDIEEGLSAGEYKLKTLEDIYPGFTKERRESDLDGDEWDEIKKAYDYRCACCGSKEGERHLLWKSTITVLQKGHMDPTKPLTKENTIPQCSKCNQADRNNWIYDKKGRVVKVANSAIVLKSAESVQREMYEILKGKFEK